MNDRLEQAEIRAQENWWETGTHVYDRRQDSTAYHAFMVLYRLSLHVRRAVYRKASDFGLTPPQCDVLFHLDPGEKMSLTELSYRLVCHKSNVTHVIDTLEATGLVRRVPSKEDRRRIDVVLTPKGEAIRAEADREQTTWALKRMTPLNEDEQRLFLELCQKLETTWVEE